MDLRLLAAWLAIACAVGVIYVRAETSPLFFDDQYTVIENPSLRALWPLSVPLSPPRYFPTAGRPLVNASLALDYRRGGVDPVPYRRTSLALHAISAGLLLGILRRTLQRIGYGTLAGRAAFLAALLWAVHPLHTEPVVYVTQRTELMLGAFHLATLYASIRLWAAATTGARNGWRVAAIAACWAGMASKESMVSAPLLVLLYDRAFVAGSLRAAWQRSRGLYVGLFASWTLLLYLNASGPRSDSAGFHLEISPVSWWLTQAKVFWLYAKLVFWPWPLAIHYELPYLETLAAAWPWLLALIVLASIAGIAFWRNRPVGWAGAWVFALLAPPFFVPIVTEVAAERRMYLPLATIVAAVVAGSLRLASRRGPRWIAAATGICLGLAGCLAAVGIHRLAAFHDELTLWSDTVATQPENALARTNLGLALARAGRPYEAIEEAQRAVALRPRDADLHFNLGNLLGERGRSHEAIAHYEAAIALREAFPDAHTNLGAALARAGRPDAAIAHFERAQALDPASERARFNLEQARRAAQR